MNLIMLAKLKKILTLINLLLTIVVAIIGIAENGNALAVLNRKSV